MKSSFSSFHAAILVVLCHFTASAGLELVTSNTAPIMYPFGASGDSHNPVTTPDGRFVAFTSTAQNLVLSQGTQSSQGGKLSVYVLDRKASKTTLVSVNEAGIGPGNGDSIPVGISTNGQLVLFESSATDLIPGDTNGVTDVFLRDVVLGRTILISAATNRVSANGASSQAVMTPDGAYVAFTSSANNLVSDDTNGIPDIFVRDVRAEATVLASPGAIRAGDLVGSSAPRITPGGHFVAFLSAATNLVQNVSITNEVYLHDLVAGTTRVVSANAHAFFPGAVVSYSHAVSDDGKFVVFETSKASAPTAGNIFRYSIADDTVELISTNAVATASGMTSFSGFRTLDISADATLIAFLGRTNGGSQVYLYDGRSGLTKLVSAAAADPAPTNSLCDFPTFDPTGAWLCFASTATNLTTNVVADSFHLYVRNLADGALQLVDAAPTGAGAEKFFLSPPSVTAGGQAVVFDASDSDLVSGDVNFRQDVFLRDFPAGTNELISAVNPALESVSPAGTALIAAFSCSADGRYVAMASAPGNLLPGHTNSTRGIMVRDIQTGLSTLVSVDTNGVDGADGMSTDPSISADGRFVAFASGASNLVGGDTNRLRDVFIRDLSTGTTKVVSARADGSAPGTFSSSSPVISSDGRYVLFRSLASDLVPPPVSSFAENLFLRDLQGGTNWLLAPVGISAAAMTPDGRFVVFGGAKTNMYLWDSKIAGLVYTNSTAVVTSVAVSADGNRFAGLAGSRLYICDRAANTNFILIASTNTASRTGAALQFSSDARYLVFCTMAAVLPEDTNGVSDVYLYDFGGGTISLISRSFRYSGAGNGTSDSPAISPDGRFVAFRSSAADLVAVTGSVGPQIYLFDRQTGLMTLVSASVGADLAGNNRSLSPAFTADGQTLFFYSWASDLVGADFNQAPDLFSLKLATGGTVSAFPAQIVFVPDSAHSVTLTWPAIAGVSYSVQYTDRLENPLWIDLDCRVTISGTQAAASGIASDAQHRFFRIVAR